jgi:hypothetical protein
LTFTTSHAHGESTSPPKLLLTLVGLLALTASGCSKDEAPESVTPPPGVLQSSDLTGKPAPKVLGQDEGVTRYCGSVPEMEIQKDAGSRYIVEYRLDDQTVVRSYKYTYGTEKKRTTDLTRLRHGISRCVASNVGLSSDDERFTAVAGLPATAAGYHTSQQDGSDFRIGERVWASQGDKSIVSVVVLYEGGPKLDKLPVDAAELAQKLTTRQ